MQNHNYFSQTHRGSTNPLQFSLNQNQNMNASRSTPDFLLLSNIDQYNQKLLKRPSIANNVDYEYNFHAQNDQTKAVSNTIPEQNQPTLLRMNSYNSNFVSNVDNRNSILKQSLYFSEPTDDLFKDPSKMFENYQKLENIIDKKRNRIRELKHNIENTRISNDPNQTQNLQNAIKKTRDDLNRLRQMNKICENEKSELSVKMHRLQNELEKINSEQQKRDMYSQTVASLQNECYRLNDEHNSLVSQFAKKEYHTKKEIENEYREKMEKKVFAIVMEEAKKSKDEKIIALYNKLQSKTIMNE